MKENFFSHHALKKCLSSWTALTLLCIRIFSSRIKKKTKKNPTRHDESEIVLKLKLPLIRKSERDMSKSQRGQSLKQLRKGTCREFLETMSQFRVSANIKWKASKSSEKKRNKHSE